MSGNAGQVVGVLLAGGWSRRFGADKLLHPLPDGTPVAVASAKMLLAACPCVFSILRPGQDRLHRLLSALGVAATFDVRAEAGIGDSLACAVRASPQAAGWLVALADMPFVRPATAHAVVAEMHRGAPIAAAEYRGQRGHPVGFSWRCYGELSGLSGDLGARTILAAHTQEIMRVVVDDPGVRDDIDRPEDLARMRSSLLTR